jgi:serine/threonine protein kinase
LCDLASIHTDLYPLHSKIDFTTPEFRSPENFGESKIYGKAADVWSLGLVILYIMVRFLFGNVNIPDQIHSYFPADETMRRRNIARLLNRYHLPRAIDVLTMMLDPNPKSRISNYDEIRQILMFEVPYVPIKFAEYPGINICHNLPIQTVCNYHQHSNHLFVHIFLNDGIIHHSKEDMEIFVRKSGVFFPIKLLVLDIPHD